ncbi:MAG: protein kinase [Prevotellaceae bacterium]|jgi:hypothetical protein|nr:protein kinase [Prevotellaceae bacterium]
MTGKIVIYVKRGETAGGGKKFVRESDATLLVGRSEKCDIRFEDAGVSRQHCEIVVAFPRLSVRDLDSTNGTYIDGRDIRNDGAVALAAGQRLGIGKYCELAVEPLLSVNSKCIVCDSDMETTRDEIGICSACRRNEKEKAALAENIIETLKRISRRNADFAGTGCSKVRFIGEGTSATVYLARRNNDNAALKVLRFKTECGEKEKLLFEREIRVMQQLAHEKLVKLIDCGQANSRFFLVMEFCSGGNLEEFVEQHGGKLDPAVAFSIFFQILDGLDYVHNAEVESKLADGTSRRVTGIVHRDIKPSNILVFDGAPEHPSIKIADLGIAKAFETAGETIETRSRDDKRRTVRGSFAFMSRLQYLDCRYAKPEVDVWAATATLFYMLAGTPPRKLPCEPNAKLADCLAPDSLSPETIALIDEVLREGSASSVSGIRRLTDKYRTELGTEIETADKRKYPEAFALKRELDLIMNYKL